MDGKELQSRPGGAARGPTRAFFLLAWTDIVARLNGGPPRGAHVFLFRGFVVGDIVVERLLSSSWSEDNTDSSVVERK